MNYLGKKILLLADIHLGAIDDIAYVHYNLLRIIKDNIETGEFGAIIILGDFFDKLFKANDKHILNALSIMRHIHELSRQFNLKIRFIYGTESHEVMQYNIFNNYFEDKSTDIKLIKTATVETLWDDVNVLYIPEEYVYPDHYDELLDHKYKYIFGHGTILEGMKMIKLNKQQKNQRTTPQFKSKQLSKISDVCVFGHYHIKTDMGDNCYYLGSIFRYQFGEEDPKYYAIINDNEIQFIENESAYKYISIEINNTAERKEIVNKINVIKNKNPNANIRVVVNIEDSNEDNKLDLSGITTNLDNVVSIIKKSAPVNQITIEDKFKFILDRKMDIHEKLLRYIKIQYNLDMTKEELKKYLEYK